MGGWVKLCEPGLGKLHLMLLGSGEALTPSGAAPPSKTAAAHSPQPQQQPGTPGRTPALSATICPSALGSELHGKDSSSTVVQAGPWSQPG